MYQNIGVNSTAVSELLSIYLFETLVYMLWLPSTAHLSTVAQFISLVLTCMCQIHRLSSEQPNRQLGSSHHSLIYPAAYMKCNKRQMHVKVDMWHLNRKRAD